MKRKVKREEKRAKGRNAEAAERREIGANSAAGAKAKNKSALGAKADAAEKAKKKKGVKRSLKNGVLGGAALYLAAGALAGLTGKEEPEAERREDVRKPGGISDKNGGADISEKINEGAEKEKVFDFVSDEAKNIEDVIERFSAETAGGAVKRFRCDSEEAYAGSEWGFYYSPDDTPVNFAGEGSELCERGNGYACEGYYTEKICDNFWYYSMS